jgi:hypothetical protein
MVDFAVLAMVFPPFCMVSSALADLSITLVSYFTTLFRESKYLKLNFNSENLTHIFSKNSQKEVKKFEEKRRFSVIRPAAGADTRRHPSGDGADDAAAAAGQQRAVQPLLPAVRQPV